jgi:hypothetical protein
MEYMPDAMRELGFEAEAVLRFFTERGYGISVVTRGETRKVGELREIEPLVASGGYVDLLCRKSD